MPENTNATGAKPSRALFLGIAGAIVVLALAVLAYFGRGSLLILTDVPANLMLLKGERTIAATDSGRLETPLLLYGAYTLKADKPGYDPVEQTVTPPFGRGLREVTITLSPQAGAPQAPPAEEKKTAAPPAAPPPQGNREVPPQPQAADGTEASPESPPVYQEPFTGMEFVTIPKGCFRMGSPASEKGREEDEGPMHEVCLDSFLIGKYEVTQGQWEKMTGNNPAQFRAGDNYPVEQVSWLDAQDFIQKLNQKTGKQFRLPTEAEWEYAARAGSQTARPWGDDPDKACQQENLADLSGKKQDPLSPVHNCDDGYAFTAPAGQFQANAFGLHDMLGNVSEWCEDWYDAGYYRQSPRENPRGGSSAERRVIRGGSWLSLPPFARSANRYMNVPPIKYSDIGFRLVMPAGKSE